MKYILLSLLTTAALYAPSALAQATSHERINYQAYATNTIGVEYGDNTPQNYTVQFRIYDAATGGTVLWGEQQTVSIQDGRFSVLLGNGTPIPNSSIGHDALSTIFTAAVGGAPQNRYIGVKIGGDAEFAPRQQLVANPIAMRAASAAVADSVAGGSINSAAIADASISGTDLALLAVQAVNLADGSVTPNKLADGAVNANKLGNGAVTNGKLADGAVTSAKIAANSILADNIATSAVGADEIAFGAVGTSEANFAYTDEDGIHFHLPSQQPDGTSPFPTFEIQNYATTGGVFYFHGFPNNVRRSGALFFDSGNYLRLRRDINDPGSARLGPDGEWGSSSDARLKKDITPAGGLLEKALRIKPVHFYWKTEAGSEPAHFGVIAQDVEQVIPELVNKGDSWTVNYSGLGLVAIGAIQEQQVMLKDQGARLEALEKENADLKARLERLEQALGTVK